MVQTTLSNLVSSKSASRVYNNPNTRNIRVNDTKTKEVQDSHNMGMTKTIVVSPGPIESHSIHKTPELLNHN